MKIFKDRRAAGLLLAQQLQGVKADYVLGIPRGGVVVASEIAKALKLPLDILVTRKIGAPTQPELALGALDPDGEIVWEEEMIKDLGLISKDLGEIVKNEWRELKRREDLYRDGKRQPNLENKTVILVDDGIATGATVLAATRYLLKYKAKIILAIPVASTDSLEKITPEVNKVIVLDTPDPFGSVGQFYHEFQPVSDEIVISLLK